MKSRKPKLQRSDIEVNLPPRWGFSCFWVIGYKDVAPPELRNGGLVKTCEVALIERQWRWGEGEAQVSSTRVKDSAYRSGFLNLEQICHLVANLRYVEDTPRPGESGVKSAL